MPFNFDRVRETAARWADDAHPARAEAVTRFRESGLFNELQVAFALNEQMTALAAFRPPEGEEEGHTGAVTIEPADAQPLSGLAEGLAVAARGAVPHLPGDAFGLTRAFLDAAGVQVGEAHGSGARWVPFEGGDAWPLHVAVLDGKENAEACEALAEDVLLYNGASARCVKVVVAPPGVAPDRYLAAFAEFRARVPAPAALSAQVRIMEAFARKADTPRAALDDDSLLVTRGAPEPQRPGHLRWVHAATGEAHALFDRPVRVFARRGHPLALPVEPLGEAHRPGVDRFCHAWEAFGAWAAVQAAR